MNSDRYKVPNKSWREAIQDAFEHAQELDEQSTIITGLLLFDAIRNSYPQAEVDDVIAELPEALCVSLRLKRLLDQGLVLKFLGPDGSIRYKAAQNY